MADPSRYSGRYASASGRRSPVYHPGRASLPVGINYPSYADPYTTDHYGGDIHVTPVSHHDTMLPVRAPGDHRTTSIPITTTTYAVKKEREPVSSISRSTSVRDGSATGSRHRSSTLDSSRRPPIIVTTKHASPPSRAAHAFPNARSDSPIREPYRTSDELQYYTQPGSSIHRARSTNRAPYTATPLDTDDYARLRERTGDDRLRAGAYRPPREPAIYPYEPRHAPPVDIGSDGYEYTNPSDLVRYDLDTTRPHRHGRRDSYDHGYQRPSVSVSSDVARPYEQNERRFRGPPPTSRALDKYNRAADAGIYDRPEVQMPLPPAAPLAPHLSRSGRLSPGSPPGERRSASRSRPVSYQEPDYLSRDRGPNHERDARDRKYFQDDVSTRGFGLRIDPKDVDDVRRETREPESRTREELRNKRDSRVEDRVRARRSDEDFEPPRRRDDRKEYVDREPSTKTDDRKSHDDRSPKRRMDDDWEFVPRKDDRKEAREPRSAPEIRVHDEDADRKHRREGASSRERDYVGDAKDDRDDRKDRIKEKVTAGLGIAAAAMGLGTALKDKDGKDAQADRSDREGDSRDERKEDRPSNRRSHDSDDLRSWEDGDKHTRPSERQRSSRREADGRRSPPDDGLGSAEPTRDRDPDRNRDRNDERYRKARDTETSDDLKQYNHRATEAALTGEAADRPSRDTSASSADATSSRSRRKLRSSSFNPNDTNDLVALKAQLAAKESRDEEKADRPERASAPVREPPLERRSPPAEGDVDKYALVPAAQADVEGRGREMTVAEQDERQVRVVSPPRDKDDKKPIKGILKPPKPQFPEEPNPIREGVAPHKADKSKADVPPGARWTKISRALVNPDALTIGKERFEVRDDFVIVLRVLSKEEIQAYATATAQLREMKRQEYEKDKARIETDEPDSIRDDDRRRKHRHHRRGRDDDYDEDRRERDRDRDRGDRERDEDKDRDGHRRRRHYRQHEIDGDNYDDDVEDRPKAIEYHGHGHHRSHRVGE